MIDRRQFCLASASLLLASSRAGAEPFDLKAIEQARILRNGAAALKEQPVTITAFRAERSPGDPHEYYSEADYWWPDPANPNGPFIQRDGFSFPGKFTEHRNALIRLSLLVPALAAAWKLTGDRSYADHALRHLRAWFTDEPTRMAPHLEYSQAIIGLNKGRGIGIIDTLHLVEVARAAQLLPEQPGVTRWFADYLQWMISSNNGHAERDQKNNHGTCWVLQTAQFAALTGNKEVTAQAAERIRTVILPNQISADGSQKLELARTKPFSYSLFNLDVLATAAHILGLWTSEPAVRRAVDFMFPFIADKGKWPFPHDVEYWDDLPVRQVNLLFAGLNLREPRYLDLWRTLDPDPTVGEIIRNFPIRQPLLWV